jgi:hypothetical protein
MKDALSAITTVNIFFFNDLDEKKQHFKKAQKNKKQLTLHHL